ncbi:MAG: YggS family pyridoxal phosphate-dependent enzyme [Clostridia bacterium]|nr:YggS family pyridoxal phosphate-dependent enzyme [Clostridia bacterium]
MEYTDKLPCDQVVRNLLTVREELDRIIAARKRDPLSGDGCRLLLATKTVSPEQINFVARECGHSLIGENRVQELCDKYDRLERERLTIHFIGYLQSNKVRQIIDKVDMIHSVDRISLAEEINRRAGEKGIRMDVLCEINIGREAEKGGVMPELAEEFCERIAELPNLRLRGIMTMAPKLEDESGYVPYFEETEQIYERIRARVIPGTQFDTLSMGMSESYRVAARCGSNLVRVGSAVFGRRQTVTAEG